MKFRFDKIFRAARHNYPEAHPASCTMGTRSFPGLKRPKSGADHQHPSSAKLLMGWSCTHSSPLYLNRHVMGDLYYFVYLTTNSFTLRWRGGVECGILKDAERKYWSVLYHEARICPMQQKRTVGSHYRSRMFGRTAQLLGWPISVQ
jgi:hypothetical protein